MKYPQTVFQPFTFCFCSIPFNMENINLHLNQEKIDDMINIKVKNPLKNILETRRVLNLNFSGPPADSGRGVDNLRRRTGRLARLWG